MDIDVDNAGPQPQADFPWDSLIDTFPFLTNQAYRALSIQLEFFRSISTVNLPMPQDASAKERLTIILQKAKIVNDLMSSLTHSSELLIELKDIECDEAVNVRREEVSSMIDEAGDNIERVIASQTKEVERGLRQQGAAPGATGIQEQQRRAEQERHLQRRMNVIGLGASEPLETRIPQQNYMPQQNTIPDQIPGLHQASAPPTGPQRHIPVPLNNPGPVPSQVPVLGQAPGYGQLPIYGQVPAHAQNPGHGQLPAQPQTVPIQRQHSVYTETSTTSSDDSEIRMMLAKELKRQKQKDRAAKRMAKMKRERDRGDFCKRCGRC
ncbi:hypothetical protein F52700_2585 [Fusarium sp. NRRL 52700]|nr:hypothetical protein F52700_2585 [Fusarium sp. NRRL 52700]